MTTSDTNADNAALLAAVFDRLDGLAEARTRREPSAPPEMHGRLFDIVRRQAERPPSRYLEALLIGLA
jgi:hypothetical protein